MIRIGDLISYSFSLRIRTGLGVFLAVATAASGVIGRATSPVMAGSELASTWVDGHASRVRMVAGRGPVEGAEVPKIIAGVEIELQPGWKTYWRNPGEAGGVPPHFDWSKSANVAKAKVVYPAPKRLSDAAGDSIGYKDSIVLPVVITPRDASQPVDLNLDFAFGVCREICIPAEAQLALAVPQGVSLALPGGVVEALEHAPRLAQGRRSGDPELVSSEVVLTGKQPRIVLDVDFPGEADKGDVFAEAPDGIYLPMAQRATGRDGGAARGPARFVIDLRDAYELDELEGRTITLTLVGSAGQSERELPLH